MAIVLDGMGSDDHPLPEIEAALLASRELAEEIIIVGEENLIGPLLAKQNNIGSKIRLVHAPDLLEMGDKAVESSRKKPRNSMAVGLELVKSGEATAFVTAGNTGAAMFNSLLKLGRIKGILRPALPGLFPVATGRCVVLDIGANVDCRPEFLYQFAVMGSIYAQKVLGVANPRIGLLSNGEEPGKGNQLVKETYPLLEASSLNFIGNVEGKEVFAGKADVVVTDGFVGNVMLKSTEAAAKLLTDSLKNALMSSLRTKIGAALAKPAFNDLKKLMDPNEVGGAPLLGIDGMSIVGHGRSNGYALYNAIKVARQGVDSNLIAAIKESLQSVL